MHIVVLPMPLHSHVNPCLALARLLIPQGFTFTFVLTDDLAAKFDPNASNAEAEQSNTPTIHYASIPSPPTPLASGTAFNLKSVLHAIDSLRPGFEALLRKLISSPPGVSCIIADSFFSWCPQVASEFQIPAFAFYTSNAHTCTLALHSEILFAKGVLPVKDPDGMVDCVPGLPTIRAGDLPHPMLVYPSFFLGRAKGLQKMAGAIINTVHELETEALEVLRGIVPVYSIAPVLLMRGRSEKSEGGETVGLWTAERECLKWLDTRPASSVLFIAFGSLASMSNDQMKELAEGLEASGQAFLWVIRSNAVEMPLSTLLPEGFTERTKDRGLIISWAPQVEVLSHPAVGGFLTHCGWNSVTENLSLGGVPMICLPQIAEQRLNQRLLVDKWKVGLELREEGGLVRRSEVEKVVTQLMQGDEGRELKKRVLELKEMVSLAVREGGSSQSYLEALGHDIKKLGVITPQMRASS